MSQQDPRMKQTVAMANLIGQVGCVTGFIAVLIIAVAFAAGWYLDGLLGNEKKIFTIIFMVGSFPVTLYAMVRISLTTMQRAQKKIETINLSDREDT